MTNINEREIVEFGGIQFEAWTFPSLEADGKLVRTLIPLAQEGPKDRFPADGPYHRSMLAASRGISAHILDVIGEKNQIPGLPKCVNEHGFSAAHLNLLGDDDFYPECWQVLQACGWASNYGQLAKSTYETVREHDGSEVFTLAKDCFGEASDCYILERAGIYLTEPFTRPWYAANILSAYYARQDDVLFGYLWAEYRLKLRVQKIANTGGKVISASRQAGERTQALHKDLRDQRFRRMSELLDNLGVDSAAAQCETEGLGNWSTIKRQWNRYHKKGDT
ncbi:hypothetical protein [Roseovarius sp. Pro17]|uniref:hypothetical protein n=1 Tax=Roseovarius sp. Pro17 TaxID=3108175 RepID=UPI002D782A9B|nr:hypothetical protein [Roseovarius sp. Pro17]